MAIIRCTHLGKSYRRGRSRSLGARLATWVGRPAGRPPGDGAEFWALRDLTLEVQPGEAVGLIGPNGAGKTTLLKLIARITEPTTGHIQVDGKVAALIELGAGFHPELTGRENIFLNGTILGLARTETRARLDSIVSFAGIGPFLETPLKHYSSGMAVRLGFAVAVHVDAPVLLVDEVLAVGDFAFQRRCLEKLHDLLRQGRTILFVSHNLHLFQAVATRALYLDQGEMRAAGGVVDVLGQYLDDMNRRLAGRDALAPAADHDSRGTGVRITGVVLRDVEGRETATIGFGEPLTVRVRYRAPSPVERASMGVSVWTDDGVRVATIDTRLAGHPLGRIAGTGHVDCLLPSVALVPGTYFLRGGIYDGETGWPYERWGWERGDALPLCVQATGKSASVLLTREHGVVHLPASWNWGERQEPAEAVP
jgi:lipopolysaccharide transport system ATP-binding protein